MPLPLLSFLPIAAVLAYMPVSFRAAGLAKLKKFNNIEPRWILNHPKLLDDKSPEAAFVRRANAAHLNGLEAFSFFAAAVLAAKLSGVDESYAANVALIHVSGRFAYTLIYLYAVRCFTFA